MGTRFSLAPLLSLLFLFGGNILLPAREVPRVINLGQSLNPDQRQVWSVSQNGKGFWYMGATGGLLEFDGKWWNTFHLPHDQTIRAVAIDSMGRVYTGGFESFGHWTPDVEKGLVYKSLSDGLHLNKEEIWNIEIGPEGAIYFQTFSSIYRYKQNRLEALYPPGNILFMRSIRGQMVIPVLDEGLYTLERNGTFKFIKGSEFFAGSEVKLLTPQSDGTFLAGTEDQGIFEYRNGHFEPWNEALNDQLTNVQLNTGFLLSNGDLALGTLLKGVLIADKNGAVKYHLHAGNGLQNNTILALDEDEKGNLIIGTDNGIDLAVLSDPLLYYFDKLGTIGTVYAATVFENDLYLGTNQGLFKRSLGTEGSDSHLIKSTQGQVWSLKKMGDQLLCGHNIGTFAIKKGEATLLSKINGGWSFALHPIDSNLLIQGTYTGLVAFRKGPDGVVRLLGRIPNFTQSSHQLVFDQDGSLWVTHPNRGLFRLQLTPDGTSVLDAREYTEADGLPSTYRLSLLRKEEAVLVSSNRDFFQLDIHNDRFYRITEADRFPFNARGVPLQKKFRFGEHTFCVYESGIVYRNSGDSIRLQVRLIPRYPTITPLDSNLFLFGLKDGFALFEADRKAVSTPNRNHLYFRKIKSPDREIHLDEHQEHLHFRARENNLEFYFTSTDPERPADLEFKLKGFSEEWKVVEQEAYQAFTNLTGGEYIFYLRDRNRPENTILLPFSIGYHWYETTLARAILSLLILTLFLLTNQWYKMRIRALRLAKEKQLQEERIRNKNEKLQAEIISKSKELANTASSLVRKNDLLETIKEQLAQVKRQGEQFSGRSYQRLVHLINHNLNNDEDRLLFETNLSEVHDSFFKKLIQEYPDLTPGDLRLAAYLRMNLSSKDIAPLLNISLRGVENKRYRLRKKMDLHPDENLTEFMMRF